MTPRHTYWTILIGTAPTAFRAADRADLLPTFERVREKQPDAVLKWFARGRLWDSPEAQRDMERAARVGDRDEAPRNGKEQVPPRASPVQAGPAWRSSPKLCDRRSHDQPARV